MSTKTISKKKEWIYLYRTVDSEGKIIDFYLSKNRKIKLAKRFFKKALASCHTSKPDMLTVNNNPAYLKAVKKSQKTRALPVEIQLRQIKYLNNMFEQDHQFFKKRVQYMLRFQSS